VFYLKLAVLPWQSMTGLLICNRGYCIAVVVEAIMDIPSHGFQNPPTLEALLPTLVNIEQANSLFDLMPGMEYCMYDQPSGHDCTVTL